MTVTCPKGHPSETDDYCDTCGAVIGGAPPTAPPVVASPPPVAAAPPAAPVAAPVAAPECPTCGTANASGTRFCESCGTALTGVPAPAPAAPAPAAAAAVVGWEAVASADREYFERMDAEGVTFPAVYPDRRFPLQGERIAIGRRSASKGVNPDIDLSAAPEDIGVSHQHAVLVAEAAGGWSLIDPGSTNGTYLNDSTTPLMVNQPTPVGDGDRIHVGAWTTLTVRQVSA